MTCRAARQPERQTTRGIRRIARATRRWAWLYGWAAARGARPGCDTPTGADRHSGGGGERGVPPGSRRRHTELRVPAGSVGRAGRLDIVHTTGHVVQRRARATHHPFLQPQPIRAQPRSFANGPIRVTWQDSRDTSTVWARLTGSAMVSPNAIPWLRLQMTGVQVGPTGGGTLAVTTFIQRLNTVGGLAPATGCDIPTDVGRKAFVPYTADYFFYRATTGN